MGMVSQKMGKIIILVIIFALFGCGKDRIEQIELEKELPQFSVNDFRMDSMSGDFRKYTIFAKKIEQYETRGIVEADTLTVWFYNELGDTTSILTSDYGEYTLKGNYMELIGNIKITSLEKEDLYLLTDSLIYNKENDLVNSDSWVEIHQKGNILKGIGFQGTSSLSRIEIYKITGSGAFEEPKKEK